MEITVYNLQGQEKGKISLSGVFERKISPSLMHEVIKGYQANQRAGTHSTKTRGEVSGGGRKPWKEKGTGNARAGSNRSPLWRKGGIIFGPRPHSYYQNIPQQKRRLSLEMALASRAKDGRILIVDSLAVNEPKTKGVAGILKSLKVTGETVLMVSDKIDPMVRRAGRNIPGLVLIEAAKLNTYMVMWAHTVILTEAAVAQLNRPSDKQ